MKSLAPAVFVGILACAVNVNATPIYHPSGSNLSYGFTSNKQGLHASINNPASAASWTKQDEENLYRFGLLSIGFGAEYGDTDNLFEEIDAQIDRFQNTVIPSSASTPAQQEAFIQTQVDELNNLLTKVDENGYGKAFFSGHVPFMPLVASTKWLGGSVTFDFNFSAIAQAEAMHDNILFNYADAANGNTSATNDVVVSVDTTNNTLTFNINNDDSFLVRAAAIGEFSLGYSRLAWSSPGGDLYAGARAKMYRVGLIQKVERLADTANADTQSTFENISDDDYTDSTGVGMDVGVLWAASNYRLGVTVENINEPSFDYNQLDYVALNYDTNRNVYQRLRGLTNYTMERQIKLEGSLFMKNQLLLLNTSLDANPVMDPFGDEYQWMNVNAALAIDSWLIPDLRAGLRRNLAGSKLSYLTFGLTAFKGFNLDIAYGLEKVEIDGTSAPRSFIVNMGFDVTF